MDIDALLGIYVGLELQMNTIKNLEFSFRLPQHLIDGEGTVDASGHKDGDASSPCNVSLLETFMTFNGALRKSLGDAFILLGGVIQIGCNQPLEGRIGGTMIQIKEGARIENPREYESSAVENLRLLLEIGSAAQRDPQRENFYEIEGCNEMFYIHISPISGNVVLLAKWLRQTEESCFSATTLVA